MTAEPPPGKNKDRSRTPASQDLLLDLNFVPEWARAPAGRNPYADQDFVEDRPERGRRSGGRDRRPRAEDRDSGRRQRDRQRREPRSGARDQGGRRGPPAGGSPGRAPGRGADRRPRGDRRDRDRGDRPRPAGPPVPVEIRFLPDRHKLGAVVREMHRTGKAYPVMELASLFIQKSDHYLVKIQAQKRKGGEHPFRLYQFSRSRQVFTDREQAVQHAINRHLDDFYDVEETEGEAPSGNYVCVGRCTLTGTLLGPPNYHGFQTKLQEMVSTRFPQMSIEEYRQRVETVHDPDLVSQWKEQMRVQKQYRIKRVASPAGGSPPQIGDEAGAAAGDTAPPSPAGSEPPAVNEPPASEHGPTEPSPEISPESPPASADNVEPADPATPAEAEASDSAASDAPPAEDDRDVMTWQEARQHLKDHYLQQEIREVSRAVIPATVAQELEDQALKRMIRETWQRESRFPLSLSLAMRPAFRHMRLHLFKVDRKHVFVTPIPPRPLDPDAAVDSIRAELTYLQEHPGCSRRELIEALRPGAALDSPEVAEVVNNLRWLTEKGHVIEFYDGTLALPSAPKGHAGPAGAPSARKEPPPEKTSSGKPPPKEAPSPAPEGPEPEPSSPPEGTAEAPAVPPTPAQPEPAPEPASMPEPAGETSSPAPEGDADADESPGRPPEDVSSEVPAPAEGPESSQPAGPDPDAVKRARAAELAAAMMQGPPVESGDEAGPPPASRATGTAGPQPPVPDPAQELAAAMMQGPPSSRIEGAGSSPAFSDDPSRERSGESGE